MAAKKKGDKTKGTHERVQDIAEDLAHAAGRLRDALDEARPVIAGELDVVRNELAALTARVAALEAAGKRSTATKAATAVKPTTVRKPATRRQPAATASASSKVPAARAAAKRAPKRPASS